MADRPPLSSRQNQPRGACNRQGRSFPYSLAHINSIVRLLQYRYKMFSLFGLPSHLPLTHERVHCKKSFTLFHFPVGMSLTKLSLAGNNKKSLIFFLQCRDTNCEKLFASNDNPFFCERVGKAYLYRFRKRTGQQKTHNFRGQEEERTSNTVQRLRNSERERTKEVGIRKKI